MRNRNKTALLGFVALLCLSASSVLAADAGGGAARAVFELADLGRFASDIGRSLRERGEALAVELDPSAAARLRRALSRVSEPSGLRVAGLAAFAPLYDAAAAREVRAWYGSKLGRRLLAMEARAAQTNWEAEFEGFIRELETRPASSERLRLLRRFARASRAVDDTVGMQLGVTRILEVGRRALRPAESGDRPEPLEALLKQREARLRGSLSGQLSIVMLYVYREASDAELERYVAFAESPAARWLFDANRSAVQAALSGAERELVRELAAH